MSTQRPALKFPLRLDRLSSAMTLSTHVPARPLLRPQALLQHAAVEAARRIVPSGVGLDSADVRRRMVERLKLTGLRDEAVLGAMAAVPRHQFVDTALVNQAYEDTSLPIGHGQTISKPSIVARMIELLRGGAAALTTGSLGHVLEVGTGCGYQTAILARLSRQVFSVERVRPLYDKARQNLAELRDAQIRLVYGDGTLGHAPNAPYASIIVSAGGDVIAQAWLDQLAPGGRLVAPVRAADNRQTLMVVDKTAGGFRHTNFERVYFVPLRSGLA